MLVVVKGVLDVCVLYFISLHIRSMWETNVMHKQVSGWTVNFGPNFPDQSLLRNTPPPENWNLGRSWHFDFSVSEYPPPPSPPPKKIDI